jgi:uncharacterized protein
MATLILKCTERCNANCVYCDVVRSHPEVSNMSKAMLATVFNRINEFLESHPEESILITWHGGEPLLMGVDYFEYAWELQEKSCGETKNRIQHCIQSNLTLLNEDFIPIFRKLGIQSIGTSYDPDPNIRGFGSLVDSRAYNKSFLRSTSILDKHGINWGVIYVVTRGVLSSPLSTFYMLCNLKPGGGFNINPVIISDTIRKKYAITPEEFADFLGHIFPTWYTHRNRYPEVEPFSSLLSNITGNGRRLTCEDSGKCARHHLNIDPCGNVSQCGRSSDLGIMNWGNIKEDSLDIIFQNKGLDELDERRGVLKEGECQECKLFPICHGGCPIDSYIHYKNFSRKTNWCSGKRRFIYKYFEPTTSLTIENITK